MDWNIKKEYRWWLVAILTVAILPFLVHGLWNREARLGGGYSPVTGFQTLTTARISASDTTIPVASVTDRAGNSITASLISSSSTVRMYFNVEPGTTREEPVICTGISSLTFTGCTRGVAFQGSTISSSSTIAKIHNAGSVMIMTNLGVMYGNEFVSIFGDQTLFDIKTFNTLPKATSSAATAVSNDQLVTKYYVDNVAGSGFTCANASSTTGISCSNTAPDQVYFNASGTGGLAIDSITSSTYIAASSTASTNGGFLKHSFTAIAGVYPLYWDALSFLAGSWTFSGNNIFSGSNTFSGANTTTGSFAVLSPTSTYDAANKGYVDASSTFFGYFGDGFDGAGLISTNATLTRDMFYTTLIVNSGKTLNTSGYRVFARTSIANAGTIANNGMGGGIAAPPYSAGLGASSTSIGGGTDGGVGGNTGNGAVGVGAVSSIGGAAGAGGGSNNCTGATTGGAAGTKGTPNGTPRNAPGMIFGLDTKSTSTQWLGGPGGGGGGGGGSRGGGGGGGGGGVFLSTPSLTNTGKIEANGGSGGSGTANTDCGGGGGGGGFVEALYLTLDNTSGIFRALGGSGGSGFGGAPAGSAGSSGTLFLIDLNN